MPHARHDLFVYDALVVAVVLGGITYLNEYILFIYHNIADVVAGVQGLLLSACSHCSHHRHRHHHHLPLTSINL